MAALNPTLTKLGNVPRYAYKVDNETFTAAVNKGLTPAQICEQFGITRQAVEQRASRLGLKEKLAMTKAALLAERPPKPPPRLEVKYGMPLEQVRRLQSIGATRAFTQQRNNAKHRGIAWEFTLAEWWRMWDESGMWAQRGRGNEGGGYQMARRGDSGPYAVGNVRIVSAGENIRELHSRLYWQRVRNSSPERNPTPLRIPMWTEENVARAVQMLSDGKSYTDIGRVMGIHRSSVERALARRGLAHHYAICYPAPTTAQQTDMARG